MVGARGLVIDIQPEFVSLEDHDTLKSARGLVINIQPRFVFVKDHDTFSSSGRCTGTGNKYTATVHLCERSRYFLE